VAVRAQKAQILGPVVQPVATAVINDEPQGATLPRGATTALLAYLRHANLDQGTAQALGILAVRARSTNA
jgi:hypothetical protein